MINISNAQLQALTHNQSYPPSCLYIVATPIGNLADITLRALHVLSIADYIACEDTRHTGQLLKAYSINAQTISCHMHNERSASQTIINHLRQGARVAYVSDAGTPCISDPGSLLVDDVVHAGFKVVSIGGISTPTSVLSIAGNLYEGSNKIPSYCFCGFLPSSNVAKLNQLETLSQYQMPIVLFESPKRIIQTIKDLELNFNGRKLIIAREVSKQFEQIIYTKVGAIDDNIKIPEKGEFCIVIGSDNTDNVDIFSQKTQLANKLLEKLLPLIGNKQSSIIISSCLDLPAKDIYNIGLSINNI